MILKRNVSGAGIIPLLLCLLPVLSAALPGRAQGIPAGTPGEAADSVRPVFSEVIYFSPGNGEWIERAEYPKTVRLLRWALSDTLTPVTVTGWTDAAGDGAYNERLSLRRARTVRNYLVSRGVSPSRIRMEGRGVDTQAPSPDKARRADIRAVVRLAAIQRDDNTVSDTFATPQKQARQPEKQAAEAVTPPAQQQTTRQPEQAPQPQQTATAPVAPPSVSSVAGKHPSPGRYLGVKTNLAAWAGTILNVAADVQVSRHVSVELPLLWCPWYVGSKHAVKTFTLQPEARYWLSKPGEGHFFGVHAHVGWFNVKWDRDRYQDADRPLLGAGISYGYLLPFNEHWAGEFTLGAGYANMRYDTYYNIDNGARIDTRTKNYWGITRVGLSVVYRFNLKK